jgi:EmrB/QacA subfamily drug resistance transporter
MGGAGALIMPATLSILVNVFPPHERTRAIAIWASFLGAAGAIGPPISGWLLGQFWYGAIFFINVPLIAVALVAVRFLVPRSRDPEQAPLDPIGALLSIIGIVSLVYSLIEAPSAGWASATTLGAFAFAVVVLAGFVAWELHKDEPMLDMSYFRNRAFSTGSGGMMLVFLGMFGVMFLMTQYFQLVLGFSPLGAAVRLLPMTPIMLVVSPLTPRLSARFGAHRVVATGMCLIAVGFGLFGRITPHSTYLYVLFSLVPFISGAALTMSPMTTAIMSAVPARRAGAGSAMNDATRELGAALGVAVLGSLAASKYASRLAGAIAPLSAAARHAAASSLTGALQVAARLPHARGAAVADGAKAAFVEGIHIACIAGAALSILAAVLVVRYLPAPAAEPARAPEPVATDGAGLELAPLPVVAD